jgi:hypothetical protein
MLVPDDARGPHQAQAEGRGWLGPAAGGSAPPGVAWVARVARIAHVAPIA